MTILHCLTTNQNFKVIDNCFALIATQPNAGLVLYQDGVYLAQASSAFAPILLALAVNNVKIYLLDDDVTARGIADLIIQNLTWITYQDLVNLTIEYQKIISW